MRDLRERFRETAGSRLQRSYRLHPFGKANVAESLRDDGRYQHYGSLHRLLRVCVQPSGLATLRSLRLCAKSDFTENGFRAKAQRSAKSLSLKAALRSPPFKSQNNWPV